MLVGNKGWGDERKGDYNDGDDDEDCSPPVLLEEIVLFVGAAVGVEGARRGILQRGGWGAAVGPSAESDWREHSQLD